MVTMSVFTVQLDIESALKMEIDKRLNLGMVLRVNLCNAGQESGWFQDGKP